MPRAWWSPARSTPLRSATWPRAIGVGVAGAQPSAPRSRPRVTSPRIFRSLRYLPALGAGSRFIGNDCMPWAAAGTRAGTFGGRHAREGADRLAGAHPAEEADPP